MLEKSVKFVMAICAAGFVAGCLPADSPPEDAAVLFRIAPDTVPCAGVGPRRCLMVNDALFYDSIEGYTHVEGQGAEIYVIRKRRPEPVPADASIYTYHMDLEPM